MRFPPQSLLWRAFLLIAALMILAVVAWSLVSARAESEPRARQLAQMVVSVVNLTRTALLTAQPDKRLALLIELSEREGIRVYPAEEDERVAPLPEQAGLVRMVAVAVRQQLGSDTRISLERDGEPGFWTSFHIEGDEYWVMLPRERVERRLPLGWLGWVAAVLALALAGAYLIVFRVTSPLRALAAAARDIGLGRRPQPLEESGPEEIRGVAHAFNQMSRDLARLDEDRALILAGISHDLRTPLTRLRLAAEMGADAALREGICADIDEMDRIIGQFLDFARGDDGEAPQAADLNALLARVIEPLRQRGAAIDFRPAQLPALSLRPLALQRLAANLVNNALHHGGGEAPVEVVTRREGHGILIEVMDRGPGIPEGEVERLKQAFTRLDAARGGASGTGLGLAIVERIARSHGGRLDLLARAGGGLLARVTLPLAGALSPAGPPPPAGPAGGGHGPSAPAAADR